MSTALYRRYRPETFGEMIGQSQVTDPLMTALRGDRVGHAYLFSGPRGCGKTTSARILARCLNCAEGPTDTPCGVCPSCVELSRNGGGSLDVVEIDAASHNGVDDARDLRERATFAPSRDRFKIFILDEAHMVTPQGFNALLKLVEEPPPHVKFIFATTEPEKVLGTIRSRTHHYPFRLVPPAAMLEYVEKLCAEEGVAVAQGVLPLVVRAGGGSPRDTLSLLDQLIAGSEPSSSSGAVEVAYERAVALLGYTHSALLDEIVDALAAGDAAAAFPAIDRVVQTGQDPRRFVDDLLERLRDLIVIAAVGDAASAVLRGVPEDELTRMRGQAAAFGGARLSRAADLVSSALDDMTGATSPRLHLELLVARVLTALAGGAEAAPAAGAAPAAVPAAAAATPVAPAAAAATPVAPAASPSAASATPVVERARGEAAAESTRGAVAESPAQARTATDGAASRAAAPSAREDSGMGRASASAAPDPTPAADPASAAEVAPATGPVDIDRVKAAWPAVLTRLEKLSRGSWLVVTAVQPLAYDGDTEVLTLGFPGPNDVARFKGTTPGNGPSDHLRTAIEGELAVKVKYLPAPLPAAPERSLAESGKAPRPSDSSPAAHEESGSGAPSAPAGPGSAPSGAVPAVSGSPAAAPAAPTGPAAGAPAGSAAGAPAGPGSGSGPSVAAPAASAPPAPQRSAPQSAGPVTEWAVAAIPQGDPDTAEPADAVSVPATAAAPVSPPASSAPAPTSTAPAPTSTALAAAATAPAAAASAGEPRVAQFPVDEEPADVEAMPASGWYEPGHDGDVLDDEPPFPDDADDPGPDADPSPYRGAPEPGPYRGAPEPAMAGAPVSGRGGAPETTPSASAEPASSPTPSAARPDPVPRAASPAPTVTDRAPRSGVPGVQRYGEAVVRQVLGAKFLREEPYEPQTRFQ
ncbi:MAG: DNA polymerase III subunit gamma and tau [Actinobacteria bacterium]|nr:DNA polymerase III subunit gamma and tau [Actinomycetota bacterium]